MLDKIAFSAYMAYWNTKLKLSKLGQEEDGMETLEVVILIAVAVIVAGVVIVFLLGDNKDGSGGFIKKIFDTIEEKFDSLFS